MGLVLSNAQRRLPAADERLAEITALQIEIGRAPTEEKRAALQERLTSLCAGLEPVEAVARLRAFRVAVEARDGLAAASAWVAVGAILQTKGA